MLAQLSPNANKRPWPADDTAKSQTTKKPRVLAGFVADDSDDDENDSGHIDQPSPRRRMLSNGAPAQPDAAPPPQADESTVTVASTLPTQELAANTDSRLLEMSQEEAERYERLFGSDRLPTLSSLLSEDPRSADYRISTCSGREVPIRVRKPAATVSYATMVAARSRTKEGRAHKSYYGIPIHELIDGARAELAQAKPTSNTSPLTSAPANPDRPLRPVENPQKKPRRAILWTEKYRARSFMDLCGDDLTNRQVLRWLKRWDPIVFPHAAASKSKSSVRRQGGGPNQAPEEEKPHRKILMLHGPPGLGKTTLAHVCARQAGYDVLEINASDERSKDVVRGRIRTSLATESVKTVEHRKAEPGKQPKVARPVCVVVDEVDGVVGGSGASGEGGFVKALIDLVLLDQKNSAGGGSSSTATGRKKKKGDDFRQMRPLILICNDVYHPSLRPLRQSGLAEIIHVGKPSLEAVVNRLKAIFEKEGIPCEKDAVRKLCEAAWGMTSGIDAKRGAESNAEGDLRGVMVVGEWVAGRLRAATPPGETPRLTRQWLEQHIMHDLAHGGGGARGLGRGGTREIVTRIFQEGAGFPKPSGTSTVSAVSKNTLHEQPQAQLGFAEQQKKYAMTRLAEMIDTAGEYDRIMTEIFLEYPQRDFNDDSFLTKPNLAYDWMYFHDACSSRLFSSQEWELAPYVSQPILACHHLFASPRRHIPGVAPGVYGAARWGEQDSEDAAAPLPFSGPRADYAAHEAEKVHRAALQALHAQLPPSLSRAFRSPEHIATDFLPYLVRLVSPDVKPVVVGGSGGGDGSSGGGPIASVRREAEKIMVRRAAQVLAEVGVVLQKGKIEQDPNAIGPAARTQWVYRMDPDLDALTTFPTAPASFYAASNPPTRFAVRQVLDQELQKALAQRDAAARQARFHSGGLVSHHEAEDGADKENNGAAPGQDVSSVGVKRDFFGRIIPQHQQSEKKSRPLAERDGNARGGGNGVGGIRVWVTYHEGLNNAVRKPLSLDDFLRGF